MTWIVAHAKRLLDEGGSGATLARLQGRPASSERGVE
jgi:hypothetical protein